MNVVLIRMERVLVLWPIEQCEVFVCVCFVDLHCVALFYLHDRNLTCRTHSTHTLAD